ncbi:hypothetical protein NMG60_11001269 [Bertholletia excelsa]
MACPPEKAAFTSDDENELSSVVVQGGVSQQLAEDDLFKLIRDSADESTKSSPKHKIQKVPRLLKRRKSNRGCYDPLVVSIGPFHHHDKRLQPFKKFKYKFTKMYADSCNVSIAELYNRVEAVSEEARSCYTEGSIQHLDHTQFLQMMFLDGCFVLQFIILVNNMGIEDTMKSHDIAFVKRDLFLLENQLPYIVLRKLMKPHKNTGNIGLDINKFIINISWPEHPPCTFWEEIENFITNHITERNWKQFSPPQPEGEPAHLLELMWSQVVDPRPFETSVKCKVFPWYSYRSVQELKASGIIFRPNKDEAGRFFTSVRFESLLVKSILRIPPMIIDDSTKAFFLNLVAYEMCPDCPKKAGVTSYLWFIDNIIDDSKDVQELRKMGIILNGLSSDQQVADLFNDIAENLVPNLQAYAGVTNRIESHYKNVVKLWITEWLHIHFRTPWTVAALFAALLAFGLSITQTYLIFHPPSGSK